MPNEDADVAKILFAYSNERAKARSWLKLGALPEQEDNLADQPGHDLTQPLSELSGIGVVKQDPSATDDPNDRKLSSANDELRRRLLGRHGSKKHAEKTNKASAPGLKKLKVSRDISDDDETGKGQADQKGLTVSSKTSGKAKRRPGSYLDEVLTRNKRQKKGSAKNVDSD